MGDVENRGILFWIMAVIIGIVLSPYLLIKKIFEKKEKK